MRILVVAVGGTHVKVLATPHKKRLEILLGPKMTPAKMAATVRAVPVGWNHTPKKPISGKGGVTR